MYPWVSHGLVLPIKKSLRVDTTTVRALLRSIVPPSCSPRKTPAQAQIVTLRIRFCRSRIGHAEHGRKRCDERSRRLHRG